MSRRLSNALLSALLLASPAAFAQSEEEEAGDTTEISADQTEPLRDRIRPVSGHVFLKHGRFEFTPAANISVKDAFFTKYVANASLGYHLMEELALQLRAGYAFNTVSGAANICPIGEPCRSPTLEAMDGRAPGQMGLIAGLDVQYAPIYGKMALMSEAFLHFDMYLLAGATAVQYRAPTLDGTAGSVPEWAVGGAVGAGMRVFVNSWIAARLEARDVIYVETVAPRPDALLRHQIMVELGISLFFPTTFEAR